MREGRSQSKKGRRGKRILQKMKSQRVFSLSKLRLICNQKKIIISSHQLSLFWPLFVNERFMLREGGSMERKKG